MKLRPFGSPTRSGSWLLLLSRLKAGAVALALALPFRLAALEQGEAGRVPDFAGERAEFVAEAKAWAESESVPVSAFQALGVSDEVLRQAGFEVSAATTRSSAAGGARRAGSGTGKRSAALRRDEVDAAARTLGSGWNLAAWVSKWVT